MKQVNFIIGVILLPLLLGNKILAQNSKNLNLVFKDQIYFSFTPIIYSPLEIDNTGKDLLKSYPMPSGEITVVFHKYIVNDFSMNVGMGLNIASRFFSYYFTAPTNSVFYNPNIPREQDVLELRDISYLNAMWVFPISVQKIIKRDKNSYYNLELGVKLNNIIAFPNAIIVGSGYNVVNDTNTYELFRYETYDTGKKNIISYFLKFGLIKLTKKQNSYNFNFVINYAFDKIGIGWYRFYNLPFESYGTIKHNINYIGFEFTYGLTLSRRKSP